MITVHCLQVVWNITYLIRGLRNTMRSHTDCGDITCHIHFHYNFAYINNYVCVAFHLYKDTDAPMGAQTVHYNMHDIL